MSDRILLIRAGGTIDSEPYSDPKNPPQFVDTLKGDQSLIMQTVSKLPNSDKVDGLTWGKWEDRFVKDSQKFTQEDIDALAQMIRNNPHQLFVITHGTDAMVKNATMLQEALKGTDKIVVFTGAMVPLSMTKQHPSDAVDALEFTLKHIGEQKPGVHIVARGVATKRLAFFDPRTVAKDRDASLETLQFTVRQR